MSGRSVAPRILAGQLTAGHCHPAGFRSIVAVATVASIVPFASRPERGRGYTQLQGKRGFPRPLVDVYRIEATVAGSRDSEAARGFPSPIPVYACRLRPPYFRDFCAGPGAMSAACGSESSPTAATATSAPTATSLPSDTPVPTDTPAPTTATPEPTDTQAPTATPTPKVGFSTGTYAVGREIKPGLYVGIAGEGVLDSCYWGRLKDVSGSSDEIIANANAVGQFYIEVLGSDRYLETSCEIIPITAWSAPSELIANLEPGTYLVGQDISAGTYQGQAGEGVLDSCYRERLSGLTGEFRHIIANDNAKGSFYVKVLPSGHALTTSCALVRVE